MAKLKKGILFTLGFFILASALFVLATLLFTLKTHTENRISELSSLERLHNTESSIEFYLRDVLRSYTSLQIYQNNLEEITFNETIDGNITNFNTTLENFETIINSQNNIELNLNKTKDSLPLTIKPYNILYDHDLGKRRIQIIPEDIGIDGYMIVMEGVEDTACSPSYSPGDLIVTMSAKPVLVSFPCEFNVSVDRKNTTLINLTEFTIQIDNPARLTLINKQDPSTPINVSITIYLNRTLTNHTTVVFPDNTLKVSIPELNVFKTTTPRVF